MLQMHLWLQQKHNNITCPHYALLQVHQAHPNMTFSQENQV